MIGTGPYNSLREYLTAIEAHGKLIKINEIDQDAYELTGFMYKLIDKYGWLDAPAVLVEKVKVSGEWMEGPILINQYGMGGHEALVVNASHWMSEVGNALSPHCDLAMIWYHDHEDKKIKVSLRAFHDNIDASEIAKQYGGGGHKSAAGFTWEKGIRLSSRN